jgi:hypothetical protein
MIAVSARGRSLPFGSSFNSWRVAREASLISAFSPNLEVEAVLADIRTQEFEIFCLGDIIGYGPNPRECIDLVMKCQMCLLGNHDQGALFDPEGFNTGAERAIFWTREQLENPKGNPDDNAKRWEFLSELPRSHRDNDLLYVHGSPRNQLKEYDFHEEPICRPKKAPQCRAESARLLSRPHPCAGCIHGRHELCEPR